MINSEVVAKDLNLDSQYENKLEFEENFCEYYLFWIIGLLFFQRKLDRLHVYEKNRHLWFDLKPKH